MFTTKMLGATSTLCALLSLSLAACSAEPSEGPFQALVIAPDGSGDPKIQQVTMSVHDIRTLDGDQLAASGKGTIDLVASEEEIRGSIANDVPLDLSVTYDDGKYVAGDDDALVAMSAVYHLSVARRHFDDLGLKETAPNFTRKRVVFFPETLRINGRAQPNSDNAFFTPLVDGFIVLRPRVFQGLPLAANQGVLVHEFSHGVFAHFAPFGTILGSYFPDFNEGLADVHAAAVTGDPTFVGRSIPVVASERDLSVAHVYVSEEASRALSDPYWYGAIVASTFWSYRTRLVERGAAPAEANRHMALVAFDGLRTATWAPDLDLARTTRTQIEVQLWGAFAARAEQFGERTEFCAAVVEHLSANSSAYEGVCP